MGDSPAYAQAAQAVGAWIGQHQGQLIYGGGNNGLMGVVAQATAQAGGRVVGVIPQALVDKEVARRECDELHVVQTMHERKQMMAERADAFLAIPGALAHWRSFSRPGAGGSWDTTTSPSALKQQRLYPSAPGSSTGQGAT